MNPIYNTMNHTYVDDLKSFSLSASLLYNHDSKHV